jgi:hypothetical protein
MGCASIGPMVLHSAGGLLVLLLPMVLSVYKPRGLTGWGRARATAMPGGSSDGVGPLISSARAAWTGGGRPLFPEARPGYGRKVPLPSLRRFLGVAALVFAAAVLTHVATCRVVHGTAMSKAPADSHAPATGEHFPNAVVDGAAAALVALLGFAALWLSLMMPASAVRSPRCVARLSGRSPPDGASYPAIPISLCVFRC